MCTLVYPYRGFRRADAKFGPPHPQTIRDFWGMTTRAANEERAYHTDGSMALGHGFTVGDVYENLEIRTKLVNGDAVPLYANEMKMRYGRIIKNADAKRARARRFRASNGRNRGCDRTREAYKKMTSTNAEALSDLLEDAAAAAFPKAKAATFYSMNVPSGGDKLDKLPSPDSLRYGAASSKHTKSCGEKTVVFSPRRKLGHHSESVFSGKHPTPPRAAQDANHQRSRLYGQNPYGRAAIPFPRYVTDADSALIKTVAHEVTYGTHHRADALLPRARPRQANLGASTLHDTIATRRTSPRKRIAQLKNANQQAKSVVFSDTVASAAEDFLACSSAKSKYVPPGAQEGSTNETAKRIWKALSHKPGILYFWRQTMAEKFARNLFSERDYSQQAAIQSLRSAFLLGIKQEVEIEDGDINTPRDRSASLSNIRMVDNRNREGIRNEREQRIHAVVQTPCVISRLVEFITDKTRPDTLRFESAGVLGSIVNSKESNLMHIDRVLEAICDHDAVKLFLEAIDEVITIANKLEEEAKRKTESQKRKEARLDKTKRAQLEQRAKSLGQGETDHINDKGEYVKAKERPIKLSYRISEMRKAAKALAPLLVALQDTPKGGYSPALVEHLRKPSETDSNLPRRSEHADTSVEIPNAKAEAAIASGRLVQIVDQSEVQSNQEGVFMDVVWLRGSNQGDKAGTYLATRSNGLFATEEMENFMIESGMGLPECGNSPWAAMLTETPSGHSRGFSFAKRGKVYRYVDDEELQERSDGVSQMEPSAVQARRNVALSKKQLSKRERRDYCEEEDESLWEI